MSTVLGVKFREVGKIHYFLYDDFDIKKGDKIIAETKKGIECGKVLFIKEDFIFEKPPSTAQRIIRKATFEDLESLKLKKIEEEKAKVVCQNKVNHHKLKMKIIDVEYMFNRSKIIFYFISDSRVDFRNLVKDLAHIFHVRIELRQVGIRDEAKILGGLGICGKSLCCTTFLNDFQLVSVKMAKDQGLSLNPTKLSGICGRLKCCLKYEEDTYLDLIEKMPKIGDRVLAAEGEGIVMGVFPVSGALKIQFKNSGGNTFIRVHKLKDISILNEDEHNL